MILPLHKQSATETVTSFREAGTGYCPDKQQRRTCTSDRGIPTGYSISGHRSVTAGPAKSASAAAYKNESHKWDS